ncbi:MAG: AAA family ATPase [Phycisphaerales bacterium]
MLIRAASGLTLQEAENVFAKTLVNDGRLAAEDVSTVSSEKQQIVRKSGLLEYHDATTARRRRRPDQPANGLKRRSMAFTERARQFGLPAPKGVLLVGVQGCGKSLCAKAVSREWNMPLLRFDVGRVFSSLVGSSEENIRRAIAVAESIAPTVLWIDEIDKAFAGTSGSGGSDGGTSARVMSTLLTWLSEKTKPVFVLATANDISQLPPELLRKGRLDEIFFVDLPALAERRVIVRIHLAKRGRDAANFDVEALAVAADGFSGAEIEQAVISALYDAFALGRELTTDDVLQAMRETVPLSRTMSERIASLRAWADGRARFATRAEESQAAAPRRKLEV